MNIELLFSKALEAGFSDIQVFLTDNSDLSMEVFNGELEKYEIADASSLTIRAIFNNKMATYVTEVMDDASIDGIIKNMLQNAKVIDSLDDAIIYAGDPDYELLTGAYDRNLDHLDVTAKIDLAKQLDALLHRESEKVSFVQTIYSESTKKVLLQNTKGLKLEDKANGAMFGAQVIVKDEKDQRTAFDVVMTNDFADFKPDEMAKEIVHNATRQLGAKPVKTAKYELVLDRIAMSTILSAFQRIFSADNVQKGMSLLKGKLNSRIGSDKVTLVDDPFRKKSGQSRSFDDEGVATKYKEIVKNGVLTTYLHNLVTAKKDGVASTGNSFGGSISASNFVMLEGVLTKTDLIRSVKAGLYITEVQGAHSGANPISGDFSLQASGFVIEDGELKAPVALITIAGNFIDFLNDIVEVANDPKTSYFEVTSPSVKVRPMPVSGI